MLKLTLKLGDIVYTELMYPEELNLFKLTEKHIQVLKIEKVCIDENYDV